MIKCIFGSAKVHYRGLAKNGNRLFVAAALANLFTVLHGQGIQVVSVFWGLWLFPFGLLVIRSGFIPRVLGYLLFVAGAAYVVGSFVALVVPQYDAVIQPIATVLAIAEIPIVFWLLIWGARTPTAATQPG